MPVLTVNIISNTPPVSAGPERLIFEITNTGTKNVYILKANTPLEGLQSDCLGIKLNGRKVLYDGYFLKRGLPEKEDYALLRAGATLSVPFYPGIAYDLSQPGFYEITFDQSKLVTLISEAGREAFQDMQNTTGPSGIENSGDTLQIVEGKPLSSTIGAAIRAREAERPPSADFAEASVLRDPAVVGGSAEQIAALQQAHKKAFALTARAVQESGNNPLYKVWFGVPSPPGDTLVKDNYGSIKKKMESSIFTYEVNGAGCAGNLFALTTHGSTTIKLCKLFWQAPPTGFNSQAGTLIHEHSHATAFTADLAVGQSASKTLAANKPDQAINNADNYEYFGEALENAFVRTEVILNSGNTEPGDHLNALSEIVDSLKPPIAT